MLTRRATLGLMLAAPATALLPRAGLAREPETYQERGIAIDGTDPIAYFTEGAPVPGSEAITLDWRGATWRFASAGNRAAFEADPTRYAPVFGGYCAYAASKGCLAPTMPEAWTVYEDKLYLNANLRARELWLQDVPGNIAKGLANWPGILG
ncbi:YHS domain-containing (seleno)protein [Aestuariicoccus sp. MJ-SS9]|uniref:YHS domain-containing (seleno)protein n=1 Tax=Aestuariicoccus sp. MJ-SS9 TaxID=3079855 RepID=UPI0029114A5B|nr:YHS domain-containing (seleno)protein [Aestuariicoccus sp. MJ-SS9]MDU8913988.1 YHS domain-containing (seleno)protein [Aestuariicoccus sp. MJ-SS9]